MLFAAVHESAFGTSRHFAALQKFGRYWTNNGQILILASDGCDANDPYET